MPKMPLKYSREGIPGGIVVKTVLSLPWVWV